MSDKFKIYQSPLSERYASAEMLYLFSAEKRFRSWRVIWIALAEAEKTLGLHVSSAQISQMKRFKDNINYAAALKYEKITKHEVMAHIKAYGDQCPKARPIIHLGATSALVMDNADIIILRDALSLIKRQLVNLVDSLAAFAEKYKAEPTMGFTHFQPALITTVGKRAALWLQDVVMDMENLEKLESSLKCLGAKGAIGTQASFLDLFNNNKKKVILLDKLFSAKLAFKESYPVSGQTYPRKLDFEAASLLSGIAQSAHKFSNDIRLLQGLGEMEEPFGEGQVGSSAMAYKRNPMRSERLASLSRFVMVNNTNTAFTAAQQWFERTLDDSANRRLAISEMFLATDALLNIYINIVRGLKVYPAVIKKNLDENLPYLVTERIMMEKTKKGGDRQLLHERVRCLSMEAFERSKQGKPNDLINKIKRDPVLGKGLSCSLKAEDYTGLAKEQTEAFIKTKVKPVIRKYRGLLGINAKLSV
jgi:adenylosuccinate lyase